MQLVQYCIQIVECCIPQVGCCIWPVHVVFDQSANLTFQPEPFFISLCLYDAKAKEKISEDFHFDPNSDVMRSMVPKDILYALDMLNGNTNTLGNKTLEADLNGIDPKWVSYPKMVSWFP